MEKKKVCTFIESGLIQETDRTWRRKCHEYSIHFQWSNSDFLQELNSSHPSTPQVQIWDILPMQLCCQGWRVVTEYVYVWNEC